ncbi:hypothetical protein NIES2119_05145 [[Phormidium ambiguum] IAM M-71]|jgi:hypothetical protein|uniref:DUF2281 domain-containing protein n=1 Tax=[Phormidium ambiguum] IAM M-71 TaxID=454136 RepID=A0A1U7IQE5_9CYAN|nr:DUF2281 domain-containing protein [Phormidium ambiguum]OKH39657.1 hypothetical protein NIES2119_05145 [Phormidium ambiguum IAM M-71]
MTSRSSYSTRNFLIKLQTLPPEQQQQVADFVEFLAQKYSHTPQQKSGRVLGLHKDMGWMSEDFNAPLADEFWLGEL